MTTTNAATLAHSIGTHGRLEVRVASWDVEVVGVDGDEVRIRNADGGSLPNLDVERGAGSLRVAQPAHGIVISFGKSIELRLAIEVPLQARVTVQSASGDIEVRGLHADQQIRTAAGEVRLHDAAGDVVVESVSGDVTVELDGTAAVGIKSVSGDVSIDGGRVERLALTTTSGDIRVASNLGAGPHSISTLSGDAALASGSGVRVTARTLSGDISSDLPHSSEGGPGRRAMTIGDGSTVVEFKSVSGDLRVVGRDPDDARAFTWELPVPPAPPAPPIAPEPPAPPDAAPSDPAEASRLEILQALERGEIDVAEAGERLARLEGSSDD
jgi:hypothetical protein